MSKCDWRCHTVTTPDSPVSRAWGLWLSGPHRGLYLDALYPTKAEAISAAREKIEKDWADLAIIRRLDMGAITRIGARVAKDGGQ